MRRNGSFALGRMRSGEMNKTEKAYADLLNGRLQLGNVLWYKFEGITLKLADNTRYTPDFFVMEADGSLHCIEVKGYWQDDAKVKIKVAAELFPFKFTAVRPLPKKDGGGWEETEF